VSYRFGFNGKENDNEVKGTGNQQDYGMRIYDPRLGRFLSVDPLTSSYPELTPYQFASNRPIDGIDLDGLEYIAYHHYYGGKMTATRFYLMTDEQIIALGGTPAGFYNSVPYGPGGKGVVHIWYDKNGDPTDYNWEMKQGGFEANFGYHGLYSGSGCVTWDGIKDSEQYKFSERPIDWADAIAKRHDKDYAAVNSVDFMDDVNTLQADYDMVKRIDDLLFSFMNPFVSNGVEGVETPVRTSYSGEMDFALAGQRIVISTLATYKQWKVDMGYGNDKTYDVLREEFSKEHMAETLILDVINSSR
jgi:RHS repeat-associated protein